MKPRTIFLICGLGLLAACGAERADPTPRPTATAAVTLAEEPATAIHTTVPLAAETAVSATNTPLPEPATATAIPTSTTGPTGAEEETAEPEANATAAETGAPTQAATAGAEATAATATGAEATSPPPPASPGGVPNVNDANYPANDDRAGWENRINVPEGFEVMYYGRVEGNPTSITFGPDGRLYIASQQGFIYTMDSSGGASVHASGFTMPTGIAFRPGTSDLYVSDRPVNENSGGEAQVSIVGRGQLIGGLPCCYTLFHSAQGITFGPDGYGYVGVGARADHGEILDGSGLQDELHPLEASILRFNPDTGAATVYARGFRNPYDHAWDANGQMWVTDNQPDFDPPEELHRVVPGGEHGYPWYDCDVCFSPPAGVNIVPPVVTFPASASPTGIVVYLANQFPGYYNSMFVTLWTAVPFAQKVVHIGPNGTAPANFATGLASPIDVTVGPDGGLFVADWATGIIFKISYTG